MEKKKPSCGKMGPCPRECAEPGTSGKVPFRPVCCGALGDSASCCKGHGPSSYPWFQRGRKAASAPSSDTGLGSAAVGPRHKSFRSPDTCKPRNRCLNTPRASQRTWASGGHVGAGTAEGRPFCLLPSASGKDTACTIYEERG